jgi:hypothetical protein
VKRTLPPELAVYIEFERRTVTIRVLADSFEDELRLALDIESRGDLLDAIVIAIEAWLIGLRERRDAH